MPLLKVDDSKGATLYGCKLCDYNNSPWTSWKGCVENHIVKNHNVSAEVVFKDPNSFGRAKKLDSQNYTCGLCDKPEFTDGIGGGPWHAVHISQTDAILRHLKTKHAVSKDAIWDEIVRLGGKRPEEKFTTIEYSPRFQIVSASWIDLDGENPFLKVETLNLKNQAYIHVNCLKGAITKNIDNTISVNVDAVPAILTAILWSLMMSSTMPDSVKVRVALRMYCSSIEALDDEIVFNSDAVLSAAAETLDGFLKTTNDDDLCCAKEVLSLFKRSRRFKRF